MGRPHLVLLTGRDGAKRIRGRGTSHRNTPAQGRSLPRLGSMGGPRAVFERPGAFQVLSAADRLDGRHPFRGD